MSNEQLKRDSCPLNYQGATMAQIFVKLRFQLCEYAAENYPENLVEIILVQRKSILVQRKSVASNGSLVAFQPGNIGKQSC